MEGEEILEISNDEDVFEIPSSSEEVFVISEDDQEIGSFGKTKVNYADCSSPRDFITLNEWDESPPKIFIQILGEDGNPTILNCYDAEALRQWISDPSNTFARWVAKPGREIDKQGFGGKPDLDRLVVKLYGTTEIFVKKDYKVDLIEFGFENLFFVAEPIGKARIGNLDGRMTGVSELHGQAPDSIIYNLTRRFFVGKVERPILEIREWWTAREDESSSGKIYESIEFAFPRTNKKLLAKMFLYRSSFRVVNMDKLNFVHYISHPIRDVSIEYDADGDARLRMRDINNFEFVLTLGPSEEAAYVTMEFLSKYISPKLARQYIINDLISTIRVLREEIQDLTE